MSDFGSFLLAVGVRPALVLGLAGVVAALLRRRRSAATRHAVWSGAILATLLLPPLSVILPPLRLPLRRPAPAPAQASVTPGRPRTPTSGAVPFETAAGLGNPDTRDRSWLPFAVLLTWMAGVLWFGGRRLRADLASRRIVRRSECRLSQGGARVRVSDELAVPAVAGLLEPVVLLPRSAESWPAADRSAALAHELGHCERRDYLLNFLADIARAIYWCNPLMWMAIVRMRTESERACDDLVLGRGVDPEAYAHLLLRVARIAGRSARLPLAATALARPRELEARLLAVLDDRLARTRPPRWVALGLAGLGLCAALPAAALTFGMPSWTRQLAAPEPDRQSDVLASPASERLPGMPNDFPARTVLTALHGADSTLAVWLFEAQSRVPQDRGDLVRERAAWALSRITAGKLIEPLLASLESQDWREQAYAAWALAPVRDPRATPRLVALLSHPVWRLRAMAAHALAVAVDPRSEPAMTAALTDPAWQVRIEAVDYAAQLGGSARAERLRPRLSDRHIAVRLAAQTALTSR
ncbi:MAG TPA: M56 family metallopeptidase [Gemmatimonadales bacterium]|nr:M56 family metallopeptidase [Gemmatimonadales bacterium]